MTASIISHEDIMMGDAKTIAGRKVCVTLTYYDEFWFG